MLETRTFVRVDQPGHSHNTDRHGSEIGLRGGQVEMVSGNTLVL